MPLSGRFCVSSSLNESSTGVSPGPGGEIKIPVVRSGTEPEKGFSVDSKNSQEKCESSIKVSSHQVVQK